MYLLRAALFIVTTGVLANSVEAQSYAPRDAPKVIVTVAAPIFVLPDNTRTPLRVASIGSQLALIKAEGDWYNVEFRDPQYGPRVGYIEKKNARVSEPIATQPMDLSVRDNDRLSDPPNAEIRETPRQAATPRQISDPRTQLTQRHDGFWFNAGMGIGSLGCDGCIARTNGLSGGLSLGGTISQKVLLGFGTTGWARSEFGELLTVGTLDARLRFYPSGRYGFFLTGGIGLGSISVDSSTETGVGVVLGLGHDFRVGSNVSLTPFYNGFAMRSSLVDANVGQVGLGVTIH